MCSGPPSVDGACCLTAQHFREAPRVENAVESEIETVPGSSDENSVDDVSGPEVDAKQSSSDFGFEWRIEEATEICQEGAPGGTGPINVDPADSPPRILRPHQRADPDNR
jgi:hypothetical protein